MLLEFQGLSVFGGGRVVFTPPLPSQGLDDLRSIAGTVASLVFVGDYLSLSESNFKSYPFFLKPRVKTFFFSCSPSQL